MSEYPKYELIREFKYTRTVPINPDYFYISQISLLYDGRRFKIRMGTYSFEGIYDTSWWDIFIRARRALEEQTMIVNPEAIVFYQAMLNYFECMLLKCVREP